MAITLVRRYLPDVTLALCAVLFVAVRLSAGAPDSTTAGRCNQALAALPPPASESIHVTAWVPAPSGTCELAEMLALAASKTHAPVVHVVPQTIEVLERFTASVFAQAAAAQAAPDISIVDNLNYVELAEQGYLAPLDTCRAQHPEFDGVHEEAWRQASFGGKTWAVPAAVDLGVLYFNKDKLRALNWTPAMIDSLPQRIGRGEWTLDDMLHTIRQARSLGIIAEGEGFWPNYHRAHSLWLAYLAYGGRLYDRDSGELIVDPAALQGAFQFHRTLHAEKIMPPSFSTRANLAAWPGGAIWRDAEAHGLPLFWQASTSFWKGFVASTPAGGEADLLTHTGMALFPAAIKGQPGHAWAHYFSMYVVASEQASGRHLQAAACALLAKTLAADVHALNVAQTSRLSPLSVQPLHPAFAGGRAAAPSTYLWDHTEAFPSYVPMAHVYGAILLEFLARVEGGELPPQTAADAAVLRLQNELGAAIRVE
jgi:inositol-phosphate transport system substrate-binding protein